jgi:hypothetical protein
MPDTLEPGGGGRYPSDMESRVAVLEQIARTTTASLDRIERRMDASAAEQRGDFRRLQGIMLGGSCWVASRQCWVGSEHCSA